MNHTISRCSFIAAITSGIILSSLSTRAAFVSETEQDFYSTGDFNGDGKQDLVIVDRYSGRVRVGYQLSPDFYDWANWKSGGMKGVTGVAGGRLLDSKPRLALPRGGGCQPDDGGGRDESQCRR